MDDNVCNIYLSVKKKTIVWFEGQCDNANFVLKGVFAKNVRGYRLNAIKKRF